MHGPQERKGLDSDHLWDVPVRNKEFRATIHTQIATTDIPNVMYDAPNMMSAQKRTPE